MFLSGVGLLPTIQHVSIRPIVVQHKNLLASYILTNATNVCVCSVTVVKTSTSPFCFHVHLYSVNSYV